jgi:hypothetical protein
MARLMFLWVPLTPEQKKKLEKIVLEWKLDDEMYNI